MADSSLADVNAQVRPRKVRGQAVAAARYQRRLAAAGDDPGAVFMAHVDRIRALKNALLIRSATDLLAGLIERHQRVEDSAVEPKFTREIHSTLAGMQARDQQERS